MVIKCIPSLLFLFISFYSSAQSPYKKQLDNFLIETKQEKIYLHFDKSQYAAGEDIWFKAYVTDAVSHLPTEVSSTLHIELINREKNLVDSLTLFIKDGVTHGSLSLKRDLKPGSYRIRAYTEWMRNYASDFFYRKDFIIANPSFYENLESIEETIIVKEKLLIDFLPEGGDLIDGIPTKVAIKSTDIYGKGVPSNGIIINDKGEAVTSFESNNFGYALCFFKPDIKESYRALVAEDTFELPPVKNAGASIKVRHYQGADDVHIAVLSKNVDLTNSTLVVHRRGQFLLSTENLNKSSFAVSLKKSQLEAGIIHLTLFDKNQIPLSERLIFPNPPTNESSIVITPDRTAYKRRSKVTLGLSAKSDIVHSASVTINPKSESSYQEHGEHIENYLLLTSDLKGTIESPDFYFTGTKEAYKALDLLMLTHGWSRFDWTSLLDSDDFSPKHLPEKGLKVTGRVSNFYNDKDLKEPLIGVTIPSIGVLNETFKINQDGTFQIGGLQLMDSTQMIIQAFKEKGEKMKKYPGAKITLGYPPRPDVTYIPSPESDVNPAFIEKTKKLNQISAAYFLDNEITRLDELVVTAKSYTRSEIDKRTPYSEPSNRLTLDSLVTAALSQSIFDLLRRVPGIRITGTFPEQSAIIRGDIRSGNSEATYYLDGVLVNKETIQAIPVQIVEFIDVLKGPRAIIFASRGSSGAILVYTRKGVSSSQRVVPTSLLALTHPGYHKAKEFYSPQYDVDKEEHRIPDFRATLYWNPKIKFENREEELTFYTSDQEGNFVIRVEGIYTNGKPFFEESFINVE